MAKTRKATVQAKPSKRQVRKPRNVAYAALACFANFDLPEIIKRYPQYAPYLPEARFRTSAWSRKLLRKIWAGQDTADVRLNVLLGMTRLSSWLPPAESKPHMWPDYVQQDPSFAAEQKELLDTVSVQEMEERDYDNPYSELDGPTIDLFPECKSRASWSLGGISYTFETKFQQALYELMRERWRAKVCPRCSKFFVATKTAQAYCSHACYTEKKNERSLEYFHRHRGEK